MTRKWNESEISQYTEEPLYKGIHHWNVPERRKVIKKYEISQYTEESLYKGIHHWNIFEGRKVIELNIVMDSSF